MSDTTIVVESSANFKTPTKPNAIKPIVKNIPESIRGGLSRWLNWKFEPAALNKDGSKPLKEWTKPPYQTLHPQYKASTIEPRTWTTFITAERALYKDLGFDGLGLVLTDTNIVGLDFDDCRNPESGVIEERVLEAIKLMDSYTEVSPSKTGIRILCYAAIPQVEGMKPRFKKDGIEIYDRTSPRFLTITGDHVSGTPSDLQQRQEQLAQVHARFLGHEPAAKVSTGQPSDGGDDDIEIESDLPSPPSWVTADDVIEAASRAANGEKFTDLFNGDTSAYKDDASRADQALVALIKFFSGGNYGLCIQVLNRSGLVREKWERTDYLTRTWQAVTTTETYVWPDVRPIDVEAAVEEALDSSARAGAPEPDLDSEPCFGDYSAPPQKEAPQSTYRFKPQSSPAFASKQYLMEWLIKGVLVANQPTIIGGPKKSLKTSLMTDMVISVSSATHFLGKFEVKKQRRCAFISGESGGHTLQETAKRVCAAKGIDLAKDVDCWWDERLPKLSVKEELLELSRGLREHKIEVVCIDPLYLCLLSGSDKSASNLFDMGPILSDVANACADAGCQTILCHHARKNLTHPYEPVDLEDLSFGGIQEFARQWLLVNRRAKYEPGSGVHDLWLSSGGSVGHGGLWALRCDEGVLREDFTGRKWDTTVMGLDEAKSAAASVKKEKKAEAEADHDEELLTALDEFDSPPGKTALMNRLGWRHDKIGRVLDRLTRAGKVESVRVESTLGNGAKRMIEAVRRT